MSGVAVLADIHGNSAALRAVLGDARQRGATQLVVLGDLVGYYYDPDGVLAALDGWDATIVRGNHEDLLGAWLSGDGATRADLQRRYGSGFAACEECLTPAQLTWLASLPHPLSARIASVRAMLAHGHPADIAKYVYPDRTDLVVAGDVNGHDLVWLGHTHYPLDVAVGNARVCNPGSVGQPRDRDPRAAWALWNPETSSVEFLRTEYDRSALLAEVARRDPEVPYLRDVLTRTSTRT